MTDRPPGEGADAAFVHEIAMPQQSGLIPFREIASVALTVSLLGWGTPVLGHGPIFSPGPHTPFKDAYVVSAEFEQERASGGNSESEGEDAVTIEVEYGLTADWEVLAAVPFIRRTVGAEEQNGLGDAIVGTKFRFVRLDSPGVQRALAASLQIKLPSGDDESSPRLGSGSTDFIGGLSAGHEGRRWYGFASTRYRLNGEGTDGIRQGDRQFADLTGGIRPWLTGYLEQDWVFLVELNWERANHDELDGRSISDTGGQEMFVSPGVFWTLRNHAIRGGVQVPVSSDLNGEQAETDYRFKLQYEGHF